MKVCPNPQCQQPVPTEALFCPSCGNSLQTPTEESGTSLVGRVLNQKYRLLSQVAEGGMALVYKAEHIFLDDICAVKIIKRGLSSKEEMLKRFQREAKLTRQVSRRSPYIISIYDFGLEDELGFFYVMELLDGHPFTEILLDPKHPPEPRRSVRLTCQICEALSVVHEEGLVHRDIKPDNIFLHRDPNYEEEMVKLLDFGIARPTYAKATMLTNYGRVMGTPEYMSPEQCRGPTPQQYERGESHLDGRSDIYSLGVLLYQCLTGDVPFPMPADGGPMAIHKVMAGHVMEEAVPPTKKRPDLNIPKALSDATLKAMAKEPEKRFQTMLEFRDALLLVYPDLAAEFRGSGAIEISAKNQLDTLPVNDSTHQGDYVSPLAEAATPVAPAVEDYTGEDYSFPPQHSDFPPQHSEPNLGPSLDRTAMDVQLPPALLAEAHRWAQQHFGEGEAQPHSTGGGGIQIGVPLGGNDVMTLQESNGASFNSALNASSARAQSAPWDTPQDSLGVGPPSHTFDTPSASSPHIEDLAKTVTSPLDPGVMEELRERARQVAALESGAHSPNSGPHLMKNSNAANRGPNKVANRTPKISSADKSARTELKGQSSSKKSPVLLIVLLVVPLVLLIGFLIFFFLFKK